MSTAPRRLGHWASLDTAKQAVRLALVQNPGLTIETWVNGHATNPRRA